jgi:hypothetical protein
VLVRSDELDKAQAILRDAQLAVEPPSDD